jgi:Arc/MetJ-type ribon-helix-helix transcriptional regulator
MNPMTRIAVRVTDQVKDLLQAEARARGVKPSDVVREAIGEYLRDRPKRETVLDRLNQLGIVGFAKDLPPDYSTNKDYMKGFGCDPR